MFWNLNDVSLEPLPASPELGRWLCHGERWRQQGQEHTRRLQDVGVLGQRHGQVGLT